MRRILTLITALALTFCVNGTARAQGGNWARIVTDGVKLYSNPDAAKVICLLEKSYYLEIIGEEGDMLLVSMMQNEAGFPTITGYVAAGDVDLCDYTPIAPLYPTERLTVKADSAPLKLSPQPSAKTVITATNTQQVSYYGKVDSYDEVWYYVCFGGKFGYVDAESVTAPKIALHPTPLPQAEIPPVSVTPTDPPAEPQDNSSPATEIVLIAFVVLLAVGLTLALFLPGNIKKRDVFDHDI